METYHGYVRTPGDAIKLFEACRLGLLPRVQRRLSEKERQSIRSGSVFVWDEREAGMRRWTDGKSWSASRVSGSFLTYREMEGKRGGGFGNARRGSGKTPDSGRGSDDDHDDAEPEGYRYKADGLMKQSFSITTSTGQHLHLISYYSRPQPGQPDLPQPSSDPSLRGIIAPKGMYPESSMGETNQTPALTRAPMQQSYMMAPQHQQAHGHPQQPYPPHYVQQGYGWPPSPAATPPYGHFVPAPYQASIHQLPHSHAQAAQPPPPAQAYHHAHCTSSPPYERAALPPLHDSKPGALLPYNVHHAVQAPSQPSVYDPTRQQDPRAAAQAVIGDPHLANGARGPGRGVPHGPLPVPNQVANGTPAPSYHAIMATPPMRAMSVSPQRALLQVEAPPIGGRSRSRLSALLHPTPPSSSDHGGAKLQTGISNGSASGSPREKMNGPPKFGVSEDARALRMLDRKFCI